MLPSDPPATPVPENLLLHLAQVPDPRIERTKHHQLVDILAITILAELHWSIENRCHWCLDMVFQEDQSRVRRDHGPANLATIRRWVLSILRQDTTHKHGPKARRLNAAWDPDYLLKLLGYAAL